MSHTVPHGRSRPTRGATASVRTIRIALLFLVSAVLVTPAHGPVALAATHAAQGGNAPISGEVEDALRKLLALADAGEPQRVIRDAQQAWVVSRASHCTALARMEDQGKGPGQTSAAHACFGVMDRQRADALKGMRIPLLLAQRPVAAAGKIRVGVGIALDKNRLPDGLAVAATGWLAAVGTVDGIVDVYDLVTGQRLRSLVAERYASHLAFTANGRLLLTGSRQVRGLQVWDVHSGDRLKDVTEVMGPFALAADNRHVFFSDAQRGLGVFDLVGGTMVGPYYWAGGSVTALAVDPLGRRVAAATFDGLLTTWEVVNGGSGAGLALAKLAEARVPSAERPASLTFAADGGQLFAATAHRRLEAWSVRDLQRQVSLQVGGVITGRVERILDTDMLCFPIERPARPDGRPARTEQVMAVVDPVAHEAAVLDDGLTARALLAPMPARNLVLVATQQDLRSVALPDRRKFRAVADALPAAPPAPTEAPRYGYGGTSLPMIRDLGREVRVEGVGVYEGARSPGAPPAGRGGHPPRPVALAVGSTDRPLVLVLSSYEPVIWTITASPTAQIRHILLGGHTDSTVLGIRGVEVTRIGRVYAYGLGSAGYAQLDSAVLQYVGRSIERFQGRYTGERFSIGAVDSTRGTYRCVDAHGLPLYTDRGCDASAARPPAASEPGTGPAGAEAGDRTPRAGPSGGRRVLQCGRDTLVCDAADTVICGGRRIRCE